MKFAGIYGIAVGMMMAAQWTAFIASGQVPELASEPIRIAFHLAAELFTALGLIGSGIALLRRTPWGSKGFLFFAGMLIYSMIVSPGYFAQQGQWIFVLMFAVLLIIALVSVINVSLQDVQGRRYA